jgi:tetratricopeptide (TPR) repeat protein
VDELSTTAEAALSNGDWLAAASSYELLVRRHPDQVELKLKLARAYTELGRTHEAVELLSAQSLAGLDKAKRMLARVYIETKDYAAAMPLLNDLVVAFPSDPKISKWKSLCDEKTTADSRLIEMMERGDAYYSADQLHEAEQVYKQLSIEYPNSGRVHLRLGQTYSRQRRWTDAMQPFRAGLAIEPNNIKMRRGLAIALLKAGNPAEAIAFLDSFYGRENDVEDLFILQRCYVKLRDWAHVHEIGARMLAIISPSDPLRDVVVSANLDALVEMECAKIEAGSESGDLDRVILGYRDISTRYPESATAWKKLGMALDRAEAAHDALKAWRKAFEYRPDDPKIRGGLTRAIINTLEEQEILQYLNDAIAAGSADVECYSWLARHHANLHDWPSALKSVQSALEIDPKHSAMRLLLVRTLMHLGQLPRALDEIDALYSKGTKQVQALQLKADILVRLARIDDAIELYDAALRMAPKHPLVRHRLSYALMLKGDIAGFHRFHEKRRELRTFIANNKSYPFQDWNGELSIEGRLLVWSEFGMGVGQNVLHMTFLKSLVALGLDIVVEVEPRLVALCRRSFPDITIVANDAELPAGISHHTPMGSLSRWFKPDLSSFASVKPYFLPDVDVVARHRERLQRAAGQGQLLVGVSWTSNNPFVGDVKSVQLDQLLNAIALPGVTLINLQYGDHCQPIALAEARTGKRLQDSGIDNGNDLDGLSAIVAAMDLVVCIGHTTAHMAGAVGTPTFVMLPAVPFAHWLAQHDRCIWYPATTLFRQAAIDEDWTAVLDQVAIAVRQFAKCYEPDRWLASTLIPNLRPSSVEAGTMSPHEICDAIEAFEAQGAYRSALELITRLPADYLSRELELKRADLLEQIGDWNEARAILLSLKSGHEPACDIDKRILSISLAMHDLEYALPVARRLTELEPDYRLVVANILYRLRRHEEALSELRTVSIEAPQIEGLSILLGTLLIEMRKFDRAEAYLASQAAMRRRTEDYTLLGRTISAQERPEEALAVFDKAVAISENDPAASFWRTQERIRLGVPPLVSLTPLQGEIPNVTPNELVIYFVADNTYFWKHGLVLLGSLACHMPRGKCHVHVINPDAGVAKAVEAIRRKQPGLGLSYSYEQAEFEGCSASHIRTYYASVRFVRLAEIFAKAPALYLCLDADCIVRSDIATKLSDVEAADVGIRMRYDERPHLTVAAGALMLRPTAAAAKFIARVSSLIKSTLESGEATWFLDQIVLSHALRELGDDEIRISQLDMAYIDWFFHNSSLIWTGKGKRKSEDSRYTSELSHYRFFQTDEEISILMQSSNGESD